METESITLIVFALFGIILHILVKFRDMRTQNAKLGTSSKFDWKDHGINAIIGIIICVAVILLKDEITNYIPLSKAMMFFIGYFADSVWKNVTTFYGGKLGV